ncbi:MAG: hypothetical protein AAFQ42_04195 [Pseudomonadota bacterium]
MAAAGEADPRGFWYVWGPLVRMAALTAALNAYPFIRALFSEAWANAGWVYLFYSVPLGLVLLAVGLVLSLKRLT